MKNPLRKRIPRAMKSEWKKYMVLFLLLTVTIGYVSGMFVANDSMEEAALEAYEKYAIEDGHFELKDKATDTLIGYFEKEGITVYEQFYKDFDEDFDLDGTRDAKIRVFKNREEVNRLCLMDGELPQAAGEIAIDRMHADNHGIAVGDTIDLNGSRMRVTGLVALSDYSTLYEDNNDTMFDALTFNIGVVTAEAYDALTRKQTWQYAFTYNEKPANEAKQKELADELVGQLAVLAATGGITDDADEAEAMADDIKEWTETIERAQEKAGELQLAQEAMAALSPQEQLEAMAELAELADELKELADEAEKAGDELKALETYEEDVNELTDFVPEYANQAIHFATDDMGSDKIMGKYLLIILVVVLAFIFAITASNTIETEAAVIGTLRSSGYTRGELLRHYVTLPVLVTLLAALVGNVLGYSLLKETIVSMYYNSYSLPTYVTLWNADAFIQTTLWPVLVMLAVNLLVVYRKLRIAPLKFLRHDLRTTKRKKAVRLPRWSFLHRFRLRILFQNMWDYLVLFAGIFFVMILLCFAIGLPATLDHYQESATQYMIADYQYLLRATEDSDGNVIETSEAGAEKFSAASLETVDGVRIGEEVTVYGYMDGSDYFAINDPLGGNKVCASSAFADKFSLAAGDTITLKEKYADKAYELTIAGIYDCPGTIAVFLPNDDFNELFDLDAGSFTGYLSRTEITDIDENDILKTITVDDVLKMAKQLDHSMGSYMTYFSVVCMLVAALIIYLLTKLIIEKNMVSISMVKVLGYENREINSLYVRLTSVVVIVSAILTAALAKLCLVQIWAYMMYDMSGWFNFYLGIKELVTMVFMVLISYALVAVIDMRRIRRIPLTEALKNVE